MIEEAIVQIEKAQGRSGHGESGSQSRGHPRSGEAKVIHCFRGVGVNSRGQNLYGMK